MKDFFKRLERGVSRIAVPHLMYIVSGGMLIVYLANFLFPQAMVSAKLGLDFAAVQRGEWWRCVTFLFEPPASSVLWILLNLYFYVLIGEGLEREWGSARFTLFYLVGAVGALAAGTITGYGTSYYLNMSLFLAFALLYPNYQVLVFFFIPIKIKWLGLLDAAYLAYLLIVGGAAVRVSILFSMLNLLLFFGGKMLRNLRQQAGFWKTRRNFRRNYRR